MLKECAGEGRLKSTETPKHWTMGSRRYSSLEGDDRIMNRRIFLKLTGLVAATAGALQVVPAAAQGIVDRPREGFTSDGALQEPGLYQITGRVRLDEPFVEISGIANAQQITWSGLGGAMPRVAGFSSFETFDRPWAMPDVQVRGGTLEALSVMPVHFV
jgi:hypothetical protein